jgi:hypothetical protein
MKETVNKFVKSIKNYLYARQWGPEFSYDLLPPEKIRAIATINPLIRTELVRFSRSEYDRNPYYQSVINKLASHTIGPFPSIIALSDVLDWNDTIEDSYHDWMRDNKIAWVYRQIRKEAALTGIGIAIPFKSKQTENPVSLSYKVYGSDCLKTPYDALPSDRIYSGIEYDENWEPYKFHIIDRDYGETYTPTNNKDTKEYTVDELIYWSRGYENGMLTALPECYGAFSFYPFIRRFLQAAIEGEEFRASFPMAIELDPLVYPPSQNQKENPPYGEFDYEPRSIKTLPVGASLKGLPQGMSSGDKDKLIKTFAGICAVTVEMPFNVAISDSSNSNMASAQVDVQPWANKIEIDRFDMEPGVFRKSFKWWYSVAILKENLFANRYNIYRKYPTLFPHTNVFTDIHSHPDPAKRANARAIDLVSGATTLNYIYSQNGKNARRELKRDADLFGQEEQTFLDTILAARHNQVINIIGEGDESEQRSSTNAV